MNQLRPYFSDKNSPIERQPELAGDLDFDRLAYLLLAKAALTAAPADAIVVGALIYVSLATRIYESRAVIQVLPEPQKVVNITELSEEIAGNVDLDRIGLNALHWAQPNDSDAFIGPIYNWASSRSVFPNHRKTARALFAMIFSMAGFGKSIKAPQCVHHEPPLECVAVRTRYIAVTSKETVGNALCLIH